MNGLPKISAAFLLVFLVGFVFADVPQIEVVDPDGGETLYIDTNYFVDVNLYDGDAADELMLSLYYSQQSEGSYSYQYALIVDYKANDYCPNFAGASEFSCIYDWNLSRHYFDVSSADLFGFYYMDRNRTNNYIWDSSRNDNNLTNVGVADFNTEAGACIDGNCYTFVEYEDDSMRLIDPSISFEEGTLQGWFNPDTWNAAGYNLIQWHNQNDLSYGSIQIIIASTGTLSTIIYDQDHDPHCNLTEDVSSLTGWHLITYTWKNNGSCYLYIDGDQNASGSLTNANFAYSPTQDLYLGYNNSTIRHDYNGELDRIAIYDKQISQATIQTEAGLGRVAGGDYFLDANVYDGTTTVTDASDAYFTIGGNELVVLQPKDEATFDTIYSWNLRVVGSTASQDFNGLLTDQTVLISNDINYTVYVDTNNSDYYGRTFQVTIPSPQESYEFQPYLPKVADSVETTIHTLQKSDLSAIPGIGVDFNKVIESVEQAISSHVTDALGQSLGYFLLGETYEVTVYDQNGTQLFQGDFTQTTGSDLYIYIDTLELSLVSGYTPPVFVTFTPAWRLISDFNAILTQRINSTGTDFNQLNVIVTNSQAGVDTNVYDANYFRDVNYGEGVNDFTASLDLNGLGLDANNFTVTVYVYRAGGVMVRRMNYTFREGESWVTIARTLPTDFGCEGGGDFCLTMMLISIFTSIILTVSALGVYEQLRTISGAVILFLTFIGLFTYFGWIHIIIAALMVVAGIFMLFSGWRHD